MAAMQIGQFPSILDSFTSFLRRLSSRAGDVERREVFAIFLWEAGIDFKDKVRRWKAWRRGQGM